MITNPRTLRSVTLIHEGLYRLLLTVTIQNLSFVFIAELLALVAIAFATLTAVIGDIYIHEIYVAAYCWPGDCFRWLLYGFLNTLDLVARANLPEMLAAAGFRIWFNGYAMMKPVTNPLLLM